MVVRKDWIRANLLFTLCFRSCNNKQVEDSMLDDRASTAESVGCSDSGLVRELK